MRSSAATDLPYPIIKSAQYVSNENQHQTLAVENITSDGEIQKIINTNHL